MQDFGQNNAQNDSRRGNNEETYGIVTIELPNGQKLDGYIVLTEKNLGRMGITKDQVKIFGNDLKTLSGSKLHVQFGGKTVKVADAVSFD